MNNDILEGNWKQFKGNILEQWGKLTDDELDVAAGRRDQFAGKLQEHYGIGKDVAEDQIREFEARHAAAAEQVPPVCKHCATAHASSAACAPR